MQASETLHLALLNASYNKRAMALPVLSETR
jgi:hypothetical protein